MQKTASEIKRDLIVSQFETMAAAAAAADLIHDSDAEYCRDVYKICVAGESGVGKSSLLRRYCHNNFDALARSTVGIDLLVKEIRIDNTPVAIQLWDTVGQERFNAVSPTYYRGALALICVFSVVEARTLDALDRWIDDFYQATNRRSDDDDTRPAPLVLLLGNKLDLNRNDECTALIAEAKRRAEEYHWYFFCVSAKTGAVVQEAIDAFVKVVHERVQSERRLTLISRNVEEERRCSIDVRSQRIEAKQAAIAKRERENRWARYDAKNGIRVIDAPSPKEKEESGCVC